MTITPAVDERTVPGGCGVSAESLESVSAALPSGVRGRQSLAWNRLFGNTVAISMCGSLQRAIASFPAMDGYDKRNVVNGRL